WKLDLEWLRDAAGQFVLDSEGQRLVIKQANILPDLSSSEALVQFGIAAVLMLAGIGAILLLERVAANLETTD
ncbi:MAG: hypothetical protein KC434_12590, partial [Anaerolineales bacterium]|nr:hypothetical protein [Anaerolineales bacterium]